MVIKEMSSKQWEDTKTRGNYLVTRIQLPNGYVTEWLERSIF